MPIASTPRVNSWKSLTSSTGQRSCCLANAFYLKGIIETWGGGTIKMAEEASAAGLPRPEIEDSESCVTVRFRSRQAIAEQRPGTELNEFQQEVLAALPLERRDWR